MKLPIYTGLLHQSEGTLAASYRRASRGHDDEPEVHYLTQTLARQCERHQREPAAVVERYGEAKGTDEPKRLHGDGLERGGPKPLSLA